MFTKEMLQVTVAGGMRRTGDIMRPKCLSRYALLSYALLLCVEGQVTFKSSPGTIHTNGSQPVNLAWKLSQLTSDDSVIIRKDEDVVLLYKAGTLAFGHGFGDNKVIFNMDTDSGIITLTIRDVKVEDAGQYALSHHTPGQPMITNDDALIDVYGQVTFISSPGTIRTDGTKPVKLVWKLSPLTSNDNGIIYKDEVVILMYTSGSPSFTNGYGVSKVNFRMDTENGRITLTMRNVSEEDAGQYALSHHGSGLPKKTNDDALIDVYGACNRESPCNETPHTLADGCIQMDRSVDTNEYMCACEHNLLWDRNKKSCQSLNICPSNPCQANRETECDVSYQGYVCHCAKDRTVGGKDRYGCSCRNPGVIESRFRWTRHSGEHGPGGMAQGTMTREECTKKCEYLSGCPVVDYRLDLNRCYIYSHAFTHPNSHNPKWDQLSLERIQPTARVITPLVCLCSDGKCDAEPTWYDWGPWGACTPLCATTGNRWRTRECRSSTLRCSDNRAQSEACEPASCLPGAAQSGVTEDSSKKGLTKKVVLGLSLAVITAFLMCCCVARCRKKKVEPEVDLSSTEMKTETEKTEPNQPLLSNLPKSSP